MKKTYAVATSFAIVFSQLPVYAMEIGENHQNQEDKEHKLILKEYLSKYNITDITTTEQPKIEYFFQYLPLKVVETTGYAMTEMNTLYTGGVFDCVAAVFQGFNKTSDSLISLVHYFREQSIENAFQPIVDNFIPTDTKVTLISKRYTTHFENIIDFLEKKKFIILGKYYEKIDGNYFTSKELPLVNQLELDNNIDPSMPISVYCTPSKLFFGYKNLGLCPSDFEILRFICSFKIINIDKDNGKLGLGTFFSKDINDDYFSYFRKCGEKIQWENPRFDVNITDTNVTLSQVKTCITIMVKIINDYKYYFEKTDLDFERLLSDINPSDDKAVS